MQRIFISSRRNDSSDITGRIYDRLVQQFGKDRVFKDVDSIPIGVDYRKHLSEAVGSCEVLLAVLGEHWIDARDDSGERRLDKGNDLVRIEIEAALARGIPVVPVIVGNSRMPTETELPSSLSPLVYRQAMPVRQDPDFHRDMDRLNVALKSVLESRSLTSSEGVYRAPAFPAARDPTSVENSMPDERPIASPVSDASLAEPTIEEIQAVREALDRLEATSLNGEIANLLPEGRKLHQISHGREILPICRVVKDGKVPLDRYKAVKLLGVVLRAPESRPFLGTAIEVLVNGGLLCAYLQRSAVEVFKAAPALPARKWELLFDALCWAENDVLAVIVECIAQVTRPAERQRTAEQLAYRMETATEWHLSYTLCNALRQLGSRAAVPQLISILEAAPPIPAGMISDLMGEWRVFDAAPGLRTAIENWRYGTDANICRMMKNLFLLEGSVCAQYLADVLGDAVPSLQADIINSLSDVNDLVFIDAVGKLAEGSPDPSVRQRAADFVKKKQAS